MITKTKYKGTIREYAKIVQSYRDDKGMSHPKVILNLGPIRSKKDRKRYQEILGSIQEGDDYIKEKDIKILYAKEFGITYTTSKLLEKYSISEILEGNLSKNDAGFGVYDVIKALIINRLVKPSSDLSAYDWICNDYSEELNIKEHHVYRALDYLIARKEEIEKDIFNALKNKLHLNTNKVFYDLTSTYFEGSCCTIALYGHSRDHRKDRKQIVIGLVMCDGIPVMHEVFEGNTQDKTTLDEMVENLKQRLGLKKPIFVADRGLITADNIEKLEDEKYKYILGCQRRNNKTSEELLIKEVKTNKKQDAMEVKKEDSRRYILCIDKNTKEERLKTLKKIKKDKEKKLKELQAQYTRSQKSKKGKKMTRDALMLKASKILGKNKRLFNIEYKDENLQFSLNRESWKYENSMAGKFLLVTNTKLAPIKVMKYYKQLMKVEDAFDEIKNFLNIRPVGHHKEERVKAHVFVCVFGLLICSIIEKFSSESARKVLNKLKRIRVSKLHLGYKTKLKLTELLKETEPIFKKLKINKPYIL
jgi:transposase